MEKNRRNSAHIFTMIIGIITALTIVCSQLFFFEATNLNKKEVKTGAEQKQENSDNTDITLPSISQQHSSTHVEANQKSFCLFEILFEEEEKESSSVEIPVLFGKFFKMLFKVIISPNAP